VSRGTPFVNAAPQSAVARAVAQLASLLASGQAVEPAPDEPAPARKRSRRLLGFARQ